MVLVSDGCSYEHAAITKWLAGNEVSPATGQPLSSRDIVPNRALKSLIEAVARLKLETKSFIAEVAAGNSP